MPRQDPRRHGITLALAVFTAAAACSDSAVPSDPGPPVASTQPAAPTRDGNWVGFTAEGNLVKFVVDGGAVRDLSIVIVLTGTCDLAKYRAFVNTAVDAFVAPIRLGDGAGNELSMGARFDDDNNAVAGSATLIYSGKRVDGTPCNSNGATTWTATRNW